MKTRSDKRDDQKKDAGATRVSDSAIDQLSGGRLACEGEHLSGGRLAREATQGRHSERAIDVPDSVLKQTSLSERAIDVPESSLKSSGVYGELQSSLSERAIDVPDSLLKSSTYGDLQQSSSEKAIETPAATRPFSAYGELQSSSSERAIDAPASDRKQELRMSLSERAIDAPTSPLKPSSAYGTLQNSWFDKTAEAPNSQLKEHHLENFTSISPATNIDEDDNMSEEVSANLTKTTAYSSFKIEDEGDDEGDVPKVYKESAEDIEEDDNVTEEDTVNLTKTTAYSSIKIEDEGKVSKVFKESAADIKDDDNVSEDFPVHFTEPTAYSSIKIEDEGDGEVPKVFKESAAEIEEDDNVSEEVPVHFTKTAAYSSIKIGDEGDDEGEVPKIFKESVVFESNSEREICAETAGRSANADDRDESVEYPITADGRKLLTEVEVNMSGTHTANDEERDAENRLEDESGSEEENLKISLNTHTVKLTAVKTDESGNDEFVTGKMKSQEDASDIVKVNDGINSRDCDNKSDNNSVFITSSAVDISKLTNSEIIVGKIEVLPERVDELNERFQEKVEDVSVTEEKFSNARASDDEKYSASLEGSRPTAQSEKIVAPRVSSPNDRSNIFGMYINHEFKGFPPNNVTSNNENSTDIADYHSTSEQVNQKSEGPNKQAVFTTESEILVAAEPNLNIDTISGTELLPEALCQSGQHSSDPLSSSRLQQKSESGQNISLFSFNLSKPKKSTFELQMGREEKPSSPPPVMKRSHISLTRPSGDEKEERIDESDLPEVDSYLTEMKAADHTRETGTESMPPVRKDGSFGTVFGFKGFKKHIDRVGPSVDDAVEAQNDNNDNEEESLEMSEEASKKDLIPEKSNSVSALRMSFELMSETLTSDDEESTQSLQRHHLPESDTYLPTREAESENTRSLIAVTGFSDAKDESFDLSSDKTASAFDTTFDSDDKKSGQSHTASDGLAVNFDSFEFKPESELAESRLYYERRQRKGSDTSANDVTIDLIQAEANSKGFPKPIDSKLFRINPHGNDVPREKVIATSNDGSSSESDCDRAMLMAADAAILHRKKRPGRLSEVPLSGYDKEISSTVHINSLASLDVDSANSGGKEISTGAPSLVSVSGFAPDSVTVSNSSYKENERIPRTQLEGIMIGVDDITDGSVNVVTDESRSGVADSFYVVTNAIPRKVDAEYKSESSQEAYDIKDKSEVIVISDEGMQGPDFEEIKNKAASLDDLSFLPNTTDDCVLERALSLELSGAPGLEYDESTQTRICKLPRISMGGVEKYSFSSADNLSEHTRDYNKATKSEDRNNSGHSHSVFVKSYRRDQRAASLEGIPRSLARSNSDKLAMHHSNVTVRSNPSLALATHHLPSALEPRGGIVSNIEISGDHGVSITSLTHSSSSQWPQVDHQSSTDLGGHSSSVLPGTTTIKVVESSSPLDPRTPELSANSDILKQQIIKLQSDICDNDNEVTVTTVSGSGNTTFIAASDDVTPTIQFNEWTHVNGNSSHEEDTEEMPRLSEHQISDYLDPETLILDSKTQIRVLAKNNPR